MNDACVVICQFVGISGTKHENDDYSDNHAIHQLIVTVIIEGQRILITFYSITYKHPLISHHYIHLYQHFKPLSF